MPHHLRLRDIICVLLLYVYNLTNLNFVNVAFEFLLYQALAPLLLFSLYYAPRLWLPTDCDKAMSASKSRLSLPPIISSITFDTTSSPATPPHTLAVEIELGARVLIAPASASTDSPHVCVCVCVCVSPPTNKASLPRSDAVPPPLLPCASLTPSGGGREEGLLATLSWKERMSMSSARALSRRANADSTPAILCFCRARSRWRESTCSCVHVTYTMHTCIHACIHTCIHTYRCACVCVRVCAYMCMYMYLYVFEYMQILMYMYLNICTYMYICKRVCIYIYMHIYINI